MKYTMMGIHQIDDVTMVDYFKTIKPDVLIVVEAEHFIDYVKNSFDEAGIISLDLLGCMSDAIDWELIASREIVGFLPVSYNGIDYLIQ